ncbi:hypothetical protein CSAL01_01013 [Colletotrichum salicis]|uniref:Uncharacterized protein n=1 Tax=Colletotrichum salicis TaxID=1209931 RepID=A0A135V579_9PEZI|nr:hypothetical protein CSAL01_01013 [Colletotrichum salicis]
MSTPSTIQTSLIKVVIQMDSPLYFASRTGAFDEFGPCHGCGTSKTHKNLTTFEYSLFERLNTQFQEEYTASSQAKHLEEQKMPVIQLRLSEIQGNLALLERQIENETRGRAAAIPSVSDGPHFRQDQNCPFLLQKRSNIGIRLGNYL